MSQLELFTDERTDAYERIVEDQDAIQPTMPGAIYAPSRLYAIGNAWVYVSRRPRSLVVSLNAYMHPERPETSGYAHATTDTETHLWDHSAAHRHQVLAGLRSRVEAQYAKHHANCPRKGCVGGPA